MSTHPTTPSGATVWFTGLPSAGKSTVANALAERLGARARVLDGDVVRATVSKDLGFSRADRDTQVLRVGELARDAAAEGSAVLVALVSPYADTRDKVRALHDEARVPFLEVHVATPVDVCSDRDVKGLYAKQRAGEISGLTGVDDPYEPPASPEVVLRTHEQSLAESVELVHAALVERGLA